MKNDGVLNDEGVKELELKEEMYNLEERIKYIKTQLSINTEIKEELNYNTDKDNFDLNLNKITALRNTGVLTKLNKITHSKNKSE